VEVVDEELEEEGTGSGGWKDCGGYEYVSIAFAQDIARKPFRSPPSCK
jgi:hypothetical protein